MYMDEQVWNNIMLPKLVEGILYHPFASRTSISQTRLLHVVLENHLLYGYVTMYNKTAELQPLCFSIQLNVHGVHHQHDTSV